MNKLEFNTVLNVLGINPLDTKINDNYEESFYKYNDLVVSFDNDKHRAIVNGNIPVGVSGIIYSKYPGNPYKIRVDSDYEESNPSDLDIDSEYINKYYIDTKEGLLVFFLEMFDYESRLKKLPQNYVKLYKPFLKDISRTLIQEINPEISLDDWMKDAVSNGTSSQLYYETKDNAKTEIDKEIRNLLKKFDGAVNPFQKPNIWYHNLDEMINNLNVSAYTFDKSNGLRRDNCGAMVLSELSNENNVCYSRTPDGFYYGLNYNITEYEQFSCYHYFSNHSIMNENGEFISVSLKINKECLFQLDYNLSTGMLADIYLNSGPITLEQKQFIKEKLIEAINYASNITINNGKNNVKSKSRKR